jgi:hypothetical protein
VLSDDEARLYALDATSGSLLHTVDLARPEASAPPQRLPSGYLFSMADLYRDRYGLAPPGRVRADIRPRPMPATASPSTVSAGSLTITAAAAP